MPKLSPTMEEGHIAKWHIRENENLKEGQLLMEVATDKATVEHFALDGGVVRKILVKEGSDAAINEPIALVTAGAQDDLEPLLQKIAQESQKKDSAAAKPELNQEEPKQATSPAACALQTSLSGLKSPAFRAAGPVTLDVDEFAEEAEGRLKVSPYAKKLAKERGIDLTTAKGTGPSGRIVSKDLEDLTPASAWGISFESKKRPEFNPGSFELESMSPMRKTIASRLQESKTFIPHFYLSLEADASALIELSSQLKSQGIKVTLNDLLIRASSLALRKNPRINSGFDSIENKIIRFKTIDIAVAVATEAGLVTPIIFQADYKSVGKISQNVRSLAKRASLGKLQPQEYQGGSFTISNLGMWGVDSFQAIINPPQAAILAVGAAKLKPVVRNNKIEIAHMMTLNLSCDHRVVDGGDGAKFLSDLKTLITAPAILLL